MTKYNCPFCNQEILDEQKVWENRSFYILTNIKPITPTHHLLITKQHYRSFYDFPYCVYKDMFDAMQEVKKRFGDRMLYVNAVVDQSVFHWHMHLIDPIWKMHGVDTALREYYNRDIVAKENAMKRFLNGE